MSYNVKNYTEQGGDKTVIAGSLDMKTGAKVLANGTQASAITNATANYTTGGLDTEAKLITAINAANGKLNSVLVALRNAGIIVS